MILLKEKFVLYTPDDTDGQKGLFVTDVGYERTSPSHSCASTRDYWLFHFVLEGKGKYYVDGNTYVLGKNYGFIIDPGVETLYEADAADPWEYCWIGVRGIDVVGFLETAELYNKRYFSFEREFIKPLLSVLDEMRTCGEINSDYAKLRVNAAFFDILSCFVPKNGITETKNVRKAKNIALSGAEYFEKHFAENIGVFEAAAELNVSRVYFSTLFAKEFGIPPKEYLTDVRIRNAKKLLGETDTALSFVAEKCGFSDLSVFTKNFKKTVGISPNVYRKSISRKQ